MNLITLHSVFSGNYIHLAGLIRNRAEVITQTTGRKNTVSIQVILVIPTHLRIDIVFLTKLLNLSLVFEAKILRLSQIYFKSYIFDNNPKLKRAETRRSSIEY